VLGLHLGAVLAPQAAQLQARESQAALKALKAQAEQAKQQASERQAQLEVQLQDLQQLLQRATTAQQVQVCRQTFAPVRMADLMPFRLAAVGCTSLKPQSCRRWLMRHACMLARLHRLLPHQRFIQQVCWNLTPDMAVGSAPLCCAVL
jgi:small-conductance mechanosensitive channel